MLVLDIETAPRQRDAHAEASRLLGFDIHRVFETGGIEIVVVGGGGAAGEEELGQRETDGKTEGFGRHVSCPDRIERADPWPERPVDRGRMGARQRLEHMVMGVDETGNDDMPAGVEACIDGGRRLPSSRDQFDDAAILDDDAALGALSHDGERRLDPKSALHLRCSQRHALMEKSDDEPAAAGDDSAAAKDGTIERTVATASASDAAGRMTKSAREPA